MRIDGFGRAGGNCFLQILPKNRIIISKYSFIQVGLFALVALPIKRNINKKSVYQFVGQVCSALQHWCYSRSTFLCCHLVCMVSEYLITLYTSQTACIRYHLRRDLY